MKNYVIEVTVTDDIAEKLNQACETLRRKGYSFEPEKMLELALFYAVSVNEAVDSFCRYAENVAVRKVTKLTNREEVF